jgi:hypothetical protein
MDLGGILYIKSVSSKGRYIAENKKKEKVKKPDCLVGDDKITKYMGGTSFAM